jgi:hypothetical protein
MSDTRDIHPGIAPIIPNLTVCPFCGNDLTFDYSFVDICGIDCDVRSSTMNVKGCYFTLSCTGGLWFEWGEMPNTKRLNEGEPLFDRLIALCGVLSGSELAVAMKDLIDKMMVIA